LVSSCQIIEALQRAQLFQGTRLPMALHFLVNGYNLLVTKLKWRSGIIVAQTYR